MMSRLGMSNRETEFAERDWLKQRGERWLMRIAIRANFKPKTKNRVREIPVSPRVAKWLLEDEGWPSMDGAPLNYSICNSENFFRGGKREFMSHENTPAVWSSPGMEFLRRQNFWASAMRQRKNITPRYSSSKINPATPQIARKHSPPDSSCTKTGWRYHQKK
jgi:hypothetical protein